MAEGNFAFVSVAKQTAFGTANTSSFEYLPILNESISETINTLRPATLAGNFFEPTAVRGMESVEGSISMVGEPLMAGVIMRAVCGQTTTTTTNVGSGFYEHEFIPKNSNFASGVAMTPYTIQVHRDTETSWEYTDAQLHGLTLNLAVDDFVTFDTDVIAKVGSLMSTISGTAPTNVPYVYDQASISLAGTANADFENVTLTLNNNVEGIQTLNATRQVSKFYRTGKMEVRINGTMNFQNNSQYVDFKGYTAKRMLINLKDTSVSSGNEMLIDIPQMRFDTYELTAGGPERIQANFTASGEFDQSSSYAIRITMINSRSAY